MARVLLQIYQEDAAICPDRVSPWSIEVVEIYKSRQKTVLSDVKKARPFNILFPFSVKDGLTKNSIEHIRHGHLGVLQGQEFGTVDAYNQQTSARFAHFTFEPEIILWLGREAHCVG
ncbi:Hypothetical predicted protein [Olea europaea subsp. europaea]|uniref:Uncharacterized protein n=1 Tax=Olea europaea subsp. europaea TaxID=158383 RepID=A0A8S0QX55_OLEEU|nr:Hypothetical predicted protein [Olea europaea subsp. europaea]